MMIKYILFNYTSKTALVVNCYKTRI